MAFFEIRWKFRWNIKPTLRLQSLLTQKPHCSGRPKLKWIIGCEGISKMSFFPPPRLQPLKGSEKSKRENLCVCVSMHVCCVFMVCKEYHVHHISGIGSSITAHSPHMSLPFETICTPIQTSEIKKHLTTSLLTPALLRLVFILYQKFVKIWNNMIRYIYTKLLW